MDYQPILKKIYPDGSVQGQCGVFCHKLMQFPAIGNTLASKTAAVKSFGYPAAKVLGGYDSGDVIITKENKVNGHVAFVNNIIGNKLQLTESNFNLDLKVHHTRLIDKNSPLIVGCIRGPLLFSIPAQKKIYDQKVLILCFGVPDSALPQLKSAIKQYQDQVAIKTDGLFTVSCDYANTDASFGIVKQQIDGSIYVQPHDVAVAGNEVQIKNDKQYNVVCLIYNDSKMSPKPNHPIEAPQIEFGFNVIEIPLDWISSLNGPPAPLVIYPDAAQIFFAHEMSHADYYLANSKGNALARDKTHDIVTLTPQTPSPVYYFLQYLMELQPWWSELANN